METVEGRSHNSITASVSDIYMADLSRYMNHSNFYTHRTAFCHIRGNNPNHRARMASRMRSELGQRNAATGAKHATPRRHHLLHSAFPSLETNDVVQMRPDLPAAAWAQQIRSLVNGTRKPELDAGTSGDCEPHHGIKLCRQSRLFLRGFLIHRYE